VEILEMKKVIIAALALVPALAFATPGAYVQVGAGGNWVDSATSNVDSLTGWSGQVGAGYLWGDNTVNYGLEADYTFYPDSTTSGTGYDVKVNGYNISLLGVLKYTDCTSGFVAFAKAGAAYVDQKATLTVTGFGSASATDNKIAPEGALGVGYQFNPNWEVDLTGNYVYTNNTDVANNANAIVSVAYHFA